MKKLTSKDLINIGIFTALYFLVAIIVVHIAFVPALQLISMPLVGLLTGPIYLLFIAKIGKFGGVLVMGIFISVISGLVVFGRVWCFLIGLAFFIVAELIAYIGKYKNQKLNNLSFIVVSFWSFGVLGLPWTASEFFHKVCVDGGYPTEWADGVIAVATPLNLVLMLSATLVTALISIVFTKMIFKKHFKKAGIV